MDLSDQDLLTLLTTARESFNKACKVALVEELDVTGEEVLHLLKTANEWLTKARHIALAIWTRRYQDKLLRACFYILEGDKGRARVSKSANLS